MQLWNIAKWPHWGFLKMAKQRNLLHIMPAVQGKDLFIADLNTISKCSNSSWPLGVTFIRVHTTPCVCLDSPVLFSVPLTAKTCSTSLKVTSVQGTRMTLTQGGSEKPHPSGSSPSGQCLCMAAFPSAPLLPLSQHWGKQWCPSITREHHCCANLSRFFPRKIQPWCF